MTKPSPPKEAVLIKLVREAANVSTAEAARSAGISKARWSQVESGYESRLGRYRPVIARAGTLARMAHALGISPQRLETEGNRPDAALVLAEIVRREASAAEPEPDPGLEFVRSRWPGLVLSPRDAELVRELWATPEQYMTLQTKQNLTIVIAEKAAGGGASRSGNRRLA